MGIKDFLGSVAQVDSAFSLAAFVIAALLAVLNRQFASPHAVHRRGRKAPAVLANSFVWPIVVAICVVGVLPILADTYLQSIRVRGGEFYRVRVMVLDPEGRPLNGATIRTPVSNETTETSQNTAVVTIPRALVPSAGNVTIYADLDSAFLRGQAEVQLGEDLNPIVTITTASSRDATITGLVQDQAGHGVPAASVSVVGGEAGLTGGSGTFTLKAQAANGQMVRVHAEKAGYSAVDQDHPAGRQPINIVLTAERTK